MSIRHARSTQAWGQQKKVYKQARAVLEHKVCMEGTRGGQEEERGGLVTTQIRNKIFTKEDMADPEFHWFKVCW